MTRCALCPGTFTCLPTDGPATADLLFVGDAPGKNENRKGRVFVGQVGDEFDRGYLPLAGQHRLSVRTTNVLRCLPATAGGKIDPKKHAHLQLIESCAACHLYPEIEQRPPAVLIPMGGIACRVLCPHVDLEREHGFPTMTQWGIPAFPMYHPALGVHEPKRMLHLRNDWLRLRAYLRGTLVTPLDRFPTPDYTEVTDADELEELDPTQPLAGDTEITKSRAPIYFTFSQHAGRGRLIRASRVDLVDRFQSYLDRWEAPILFHNWAFDAPVVAAMGLSFPAQRIVDTMARVFHLGNLPQGLKALAWRELGMLMDDFEDVVKPHSSLIVQHYYEVSRSLEWPKPEPQIIRGDDGQWKVYKPHGMNTKLKTFCNALAKNPDKDVFGAWENWADDHAMIETVLGPWPGLDISHVPFAQALYYACRDADALIRLWPILNRMRHNVRKKPQQEWRA